MDLHGFWLARSFVEVVGYIRFLGIVTIAGAAAAVYACGVVIILANICGMISCSCMVAGRDRAADRVYMYS